MNSVLSSDALYLHDNVQIQCTYTNKHMRNNSQGADKILLGQLVNKDQNFNMDGDTLVASTFYRYNQHGRNRTENEERWDRA